VLHYDRIGGAGHLQLARISGPRGHAVWRLALPLDALGAVLHTEGARLLMSGSEQMAAQEAGDDAEAVVTHQRIVSIDTTTGELLAFDLTANSLRKDVAPVVERGP
jgi:hypothetical protein